MSEAAAEATSRPPLSRRRLWLFRILTVVLIPALCLGFLEGGLRLMGYGYSTAFFESKTIDGEEILFTNHRFTYRFFPTALARTMIPQRLSAEKPPDTFRIFIFGESAAMGDPEPAYGFGRHLEILLEDRFPGTDFEIINTAITAINSHVILPIARECAQADGDLWIVYAGNNEVIGPYGPGTVFGAQAPPLPMVRASLALKKTRLGQWLDNLRHGLGKDAAEPQTWGGINMFADNPLRPDDPGRRQAYDNFRANLEDLLSVAEHAEVPVLLGTVAVNLFDCAPFASLQDKTLTAQESAAWQQHWEQGQALEREASYEEALAAYAKAAAIDPGFAEVPFRRGRLRARQGDPEAALRELEKARDADAVAVRADSRINRIIREAAAAPDAGTPVLVDVASLLAGEARNGLPGREFFYEHVHFTLPGNYQMARIFAEKMVPLLPSSIRQSDRGDWLRAVTCLIQLGVSMWDRHRIWTELEEQLSNPPFTARSNNASEIAYVRTMAGQAASRIDSRLDREIYKRALARDPADPQLHTRFGYYLMNHDRASEAIPHFRRITERFPGYEGGHQDLGLALLLDRQLEEAKESFARVLEIRPGYSRAVKALEMVQQLEDDSAP